MEPEEISPISPLQFFTFSYPVPCAKKLPEKKLFDEPFLLPCMANFLGENAFADVAICWNNSAVELAIKIDGNVQEGDQIDLFFDTRDRKDLGFINRYCHHFCFLPFAQNRIFAEEVTKLRADQTRDLASPNYLHFSIQEETAFCIASIKIEAEALFGYAPEDFSRLGFTYKIKNGEQLQHFSVSSQDYAIASHPSLWASLQLEKS